MKRIYLQKAKNQVARSNTVREINKQIVLNYVRERSPISRADIARETNLQRSTISSIIESLQVADLIEEIGIGSSNGGRKPTLLKLKTGTASAIGIDITPKITTIAVSDLVGNILEKESFSTSSDMDFMTAQIIEKISNLMSSLSDKNISIGISIPGITDQINGKVLYVPYFDWHNWDICQEIEKQTGLTVTVENDANAVALAELWFGKGEVRKSQHFITVLVSEGIGSGVIFDGQIYRGDNGAAGEFGHMFIGIDSPVRCSCGSHNCWEANASEKAAICYYQDTLKENNIKPKEINISQLINLANNDEDKFAIQALKKTLSCLGIGISNLIVGLSPEIVVVSGQMTKVWHLITDEISQITERSVRRDLPKTALVVSSLGDNPTLLGSISLVLAKKFASAVK
jgi:predicted NBD/HSP70 family sugar kinase